jgi:peptidoglycan/LPS O-acetylase OafA/YrhL
MRGLKGSSGTSARIQGLDALRGLAIILVLLRHSWPEFTGSAGVVGVVLFFTLSGYLITNLLVSDISRFGRVRYGRFYRNRAIRLLPALIFLLIGYVVVTMIWDPVGDRPTVVRAVIVALSYTTDIPYDHGTIALSHLWTVSVEEQFYLVWPVILTVAVRTKRVRSALVLSAVTIVVLLLASYAVAEPRTIRIYTLPTSWCVAMVIGAAAAFTMPRLEAVFRRSQRARNVSFAGSVVLLLAVVATPEDVSSLFAYLVVGPCTALATVGLIVHVRHWRDLPTKWLRPLVWMGTISYAAYLWNYLIRSWMVSPNLSAEQAVSTLVLTIVAAVVSWFAVEKPALRLKFALDRRSSRTASRREVEPPVRGVESSGSGTPTR